jgi:signal peptidase I
LRAMPEKDNHVIISGWFDLLNGLIPHDGMVELPVLSGSMTPGIMPGAYVRIRSVSEKDIHVGDIIVFREKNSLTTHRLLARIRLIGKSLLYQKGDANRFGYWIPGESVVGVVESVRDGAGTYRDLSPRSAGGSAGKKAARQIVLTLWNISLIIPRFIKQCMKKY